VAVEVDGRRVLLQARRTADGAWSLLRDGVLTEVRVRKEGARWVATHAGGTLEGVVMDAGRASLGPGGGVGSDGTQVRAPMPGRVVEVLVTEGASVAKGDPLVVVEAMKMENVLKADAAGVVSKVHASAGDTVEAGRELISLVTEVE
jgi:biotin carboxyl carrier protein